MYLLLDMFFLYVLLSFKTHLAFCAYPKINFYEFIEGHKGLYTVGFFAAYRRMDSQMIFTLPVYSFRFKTMNYYEH